MGFIDFVDNHLSNTIPPPHCKRTFSHIDQYNPHFSSIVCVYGSGRVENADSMFYGKSTSRANLCLKAYREGMDRTFVERYEGLRVV